MTGQPSFTFRDTDERPECRDCGENMTFLGRHEGTFNERDLYGCHQCGAAFKDRWTF